MLRPDRAEIADLRVIRPLGVVETLEQLRNDEVEIGIALAMSIARPVDRHVVDEIGEVDTVIEIETAQQILVGLAFAGMHRNSQAGYRFEELTDPIDRSKIQLLLGDPTLARGLGNADQVLARCGHRNVLGL